MGIFDSNSTTSKVSNTFADNRQEVGGGSFGATGSDRTAFGGSGATINLAGNKSKIGDIYITDNSEAIVSDALDVLEVGLGDLIGAQNDLAAAQASAFNNSLGFVSDALGEAFEAGKSADERSSGNILVFGAAVVFAAFFATGAFKL